MDSTIQPSHMSTSSSLSQDEHQDIARSSYADMLHDDERNKAYNAAIRLAVGTLVNSSEHNPSGGRFFFCCDIGTGSGLLSMMVARAFLELNYYTFSIVAYEQFKPMAECAKEIIASNFLDAHITVHNVMSTTCSRSQDEKFDLLVAELLDTELIGEGCLEIYEHAIRCLCSPTCLFIPHKANIYILPIASQRLFNRQTLHEQEIRLSDGKIIKMVCNGKVNDCNGFSTVDDMQASQLVKGRDFQMVTEPKIAFSFTFNQITKTQDEISLVFDFNRSSYEPLVVLMWWDIVMYDILLVGEKSAKISLEPIDKSLTTLSCAPTWIRSENMLISDKLISDHYKRDVWREHWMQGIYFFRNINVTRLRSKSCEDSPIQITAFHDNNSMQFVLGKSTEIDYESDFCNCWAHRCMSRNEIAFLNDKDQMKDLLESYFTCSSFQKINNSIKAEFKPRSLKHDLPTGMLWFLDFETRPKIASFDAIFDMGLSKMPNYGYLMSLVFDNHLHKTVPIKKFEIKCTQVLFDNLHRICLNISECEGFTMTQLDNLITSSSKSVDKPVDYHNLWEYKSIRIDEQDYLIDSFDIDSISPDLMLKIDEGTYWKNMTLPIYNRATSDRKKGWALVFWVEFQLANTNKVISTGPRSKSSIFEQIDWNPHFKQMVHFLHDLPPPSTRISTKQCSDLSVDIGIQRSQLLVQRAADYNKL